MEDFLCLENHIFAVIILLIVLLNNEIKLKKTKMEYKLFLAMATSTLAITIIDLMLILIDCKLETSFRGLHMTIATVYFLLNPLPFMLWAFYVEFQIHRDMNKLKSKTRVLIIPVIINGIIIILNIFKGNVFYIDENNIYNRANLFIIISLLYYSYAIYSYIQIALNKKLIGNKDFKLLNLFALIPSIGGVLQIIFPSISFLWLCMAIAILTVFIYIQNEKINTDHLTGLSNRRQLDEYLESKINENKNKLVSMIMIDIDSFKKINDTYGHVQGDMVLANIARILKDSFRKNDFISRYAGDEFIIIIEVSKYSQLIKAVERLKLKIKEFNESKLLEYDIEVSIGYDIFDKSSNMSIKDFLIHIDKLMYKDKEKSRILSEEKYI